MIHDRTLSTSTRALLAGGMLETKDAHEPIELLTKSFGEHMEAVMKRLGASDSEIRNVGARLTEIEQKMARRGNGGASAINEPVSWGAQVAASPHVQELGTEFSRPGRARVEIKATLTGATSGAGASAAINPAQRDTPTLLPQRRMTIRDLLPVVQVSQGSVEYPRQTARSLNAGMVAENPAADKPESDLSFELVTLPIRTIAHWTRASRQILSDAPQLQSIIDTELLYGLGLKEEQQLLLGDGTGQNLTGMMPAASAFSTPIAMASPNMIDTIGLALLQTALAEFEPNGIVMHPSDWLKLSLLKDAGGNYIFAEPGKPTPQVLFGKPVVTTQAIPQNNYLVGDFQQGGTLYDRWEARVETSTEDGDNFRRNLVTILAEERVGLAVRQAKALTKGTFV